MFKATDRPLLPLAAALGGLSLFVNGLGSNGILLFSAPSLLVGAATVLAAAIGALVPALLFSRTSPSRLRHAAFALSVAVLILAFVDVGSGGHRLLMAAGSGRLMRLLVLVLSGLGLTALVWLVRPHVPRLVLVGSAVLALTTMAANTAIFQRHRSPSGDLPPTSSNAPPFVYVMLDSAMGIGGLRTVDEAEALAERLTSLLMRHGFRVHGGAFSRHFVSARSIPNSLNGDDRDDSYGPIVQHATNGIVTSRIFTQLAEAGYDVASYTTRHINFCFPEASRCEVLPSFDPGTPLMASPLTTRVAALTKILWNTYTDSYVLYALRVPVFSAADRAGWPSMVSFVDTHAFPGWFDWFVDDVLNGGRGRAYFGHFMAPHAPFVLDADCASLGVPVTADFLIEVRQLAGHELDAVRAQGYRAYVDQFACVLGRLETFLTRIAEHPDFTDAVVVIHGDHGSRISAGQYAESLTDRDLVDNYSALYAVRAPGVEPGYDERVVSIQRLSAEYFIPELRGEEPTDTIVIDSVEPGRVVHRRPPQFDVEAFPPDQQD